MAGRLGLSGFSGKLGGSMRENRSPFRWTSNPSETLASINRERMS